jgi:hypothetical protein
MARLRKTLTDYMVIAISPALIMALVGSLVFFLIQVCYRGGYAGRMEYIFALFVFAAVLIARISIEEGREYSLAFAIPLALAMLLVLGRFTSSSLLFNLVLLGGIWWCADKLTWDCTVIDEGVDASGEGLLQTAGLEGCHEPSPGDSAATDLEATTSRSPPATPRGLWERFVEHRKRPHAPGVWVIYFSLAALPLFGIGQRFIPAGELDARRYAFQLLCVYTASGLGLLMTTSFLGLRRYLRQRRLEMPVEMASVWLTVGSVMIVALLVTCWFLPRPSAEYSITQVPFGTASPDDRPASRHGWGREGVQDQAPQTPATAPARKSEQGRPGQLGTPSGSDQTTAEPQPGTATSLDAKPSDAKPGAGRMADDAGAGGAQAEGQPGSDQPAEHQQRQDLTARPGETAAEADAGSQRTPNGQQPPSSNDPLPQDAPQLLDSSSPAPPAESLDDRQESSAAPDAKPDEPPRAASSADAPAEAPAQDNPFDAAVDPNEAPGGDSSSWLSRPSELLNRALGLLPHGLKWLYNLIFVAIVAYLVWRNREQVGAALRNFWQTIRDFWAQLFGRRETEAAAAEPPLAAAAATRPFADFPDPFVSGDARRWPARDLVAYSFQALEAWGREHGCQRAPEQTPHEFAGALTACGAAVGREAIGLADLYCCAAYSSGNLPRDRVGRLRQLWQMLRNPPQPA